MHRVKRVLQNASGTFRGLTVPSASPVSRQQVLTTYRSLLREITYVQDEVARLWMKTEVGNRFRGERDRLARHEKAGTNGLNDVERIHRSMGRARKVTALLRRANGGERQSLSRMARLCYGRTGKRRRQLLTPLLPYADEEARTEWLRSNHVPEDHIREALISMASITPSVMKKNVFTISPLLRQLAKAQNDPQAQTRKGQLKWIEPQIPTHNEWQLPFPESRRKNLMAAGYAAFLDKLHVPLPEADRQQLLQIASGQKSMKPSKRRAGHAQMRNHDELLNITSRSDNSNRRRAFRSLHVSSQQRLPARSILRVYRRILAECPRMTWNTGKQSWDVAWNGEP